MSKSITTTSMMSALAACVIALSTPAMAKQGIVEFADLDLSSEAGRAELDERTEAAAVIACKADPVTGTRIRSASLVRKCVADTKKEIAAQLAKRARTALGG